MKLDNQNIKSAKDIFETTHWGTFPLYKELTAIKYASHIGLYDESYRIDDLKSNIRNEWIKCYYHITTDHHEDNEGLAALNEVRNMLVRDVLLKNTEGYPFLKLEFECENCNASFSSYWLNSEKRPFGSIHFCPKCYEKGLIIHDLGEVPDMPQIGKDDILMSDVNELIAKVHENIPHIMSFGTHDNGKYWMCFDIREKAEESRDYLISKGRKINKVEEFKHGKEKPRTAFRFLFAEYFDG